MATSFHLPAVRGLIRRRILVAFRVDPEVMQRQVPAPFRPKLLGGVAVAGLCLIRLEQMRPECLSLPVGLASENAAHRVAVCWTDDNGAEREGVYILHRNTNSCWSALAGGRLFPGVTERAAFDVRDHGERIDLAMRSADGEIVLHVRARTAESMPEGTHFGSLAEAVAFYRRGTVGYSPTRSPGQVESARLDLSDWSARPLRVDAVYSSFFADETRFPRGSVRFDSALLMRDLPHRWESDHGGSAC